MTEPAAITQHLMTQITATGGRIVEQNPVERVEGRSKQFTVHAASGETFAARSVINTLGPWLGTVQIPKELAGARPRWCKGFNLVIKQQLDPTYGIGVQSTDGRLFFYVPRGTGTAIGTWYLPHPDISVAPSVSEHEIAQFLHAFNASLPEAGITKHDIEHIDVGILPMERTSQSGPQLIAHERIHEREGYIEVMSTKYTTFRSQGRRVAEVVAKTLRHA
jgi:glycerol-3-phosphate dehydrogenase